MFVTNRKPFATGRRVIKAGTILSEEDELVLAYPGLFWPLTETAVQGLSLASRLRDEAQGGEGEAGGSTETGDTTAAEDDTPPPALTASKAEWVAYAEAEGLEVEGLTKVEIQALFA